MTEDPLRATVTQRGVVFAPDDTILVVQRSTDGGWELPGGRVDASEDARKGVQRELREETSLEPDIVCPVHTLTWRNDRDHGRFGVYYYCRTDSQDVSLSHEHDAYTWARVTDSRERLSDAQQAAVAAAVEHRRATEGASKTA